MLAIHLPTDAENHLVALAQASGRSATEFASEAILEYLGDLRDLALAKERLQATRAGHSRSYSLEEVEANLGLADPV